MRLHFLTNRIIAKIGVYIMPEHKKQFEYELESEIRTFLLEIKKGGISEK